MYLFIINILLKNSQIIFLQNCIVDYSLVTDCFDTFILHIVIKLHMWVEASFRCERKPALHVSGSKLQMWSEVSFRCERKQASHLSGSKLHMWAEASFACERKQASHMSGSILLNPGNGAKFEHESSRIYSDQFTIWVLQCYELL